MARMTRRKFIKSGAATAALLVSGCSVSSKRSGLDRGLASSLDSIQFSNQGEIYEYIVVGSGAGGGPLAARLAQAGYSVLLLEAGGSDVGQFSPVPALQGRAADDPTINWNFFVKRYDDEKLDSENSKWQKGRGVYYPRASVLGGCTTVNALIHLYPDAADWDHLADLTQDPSWSAKPMWDHFQNIKTNVLRDQGGKPAEDQLRALVAHWFSCTTQQGWLNVQQAPVQLLLQEKAKVLRRFVEGAALTEGLGNDILELITNIQLDPNISAFSTNNRANGLYSIPTNVSGGKRVGVHEYLKTTALRYPHLLRIHTNTLCSRLLIETEQGRKKVVGVECAQGSHLYQASANPNKIDLGSMSFKKLRATREVIVAGGAFNSPQLLMLSGIGPEAHLRQHKIAVQVPLEGVGRNLQDRYEVTVVAKLKEDVELIKGCNFGLDHDPCLADWKDNPEGHVYSTNGVTISLSTRSGENRKNLPPDLNIFGVPGSFRGYYPMWSKESYTGSDHFTWAVLKGHTNNVLEPKDPRNADAYVRLRSGDFRDTPEINFRYFWKNEGPEGNDLDSVLAGVKKARMINKNTPGNMIAEEVYPGRKVQTDDQIRSWIKKESWGHHASCTNKIGPAEDPTAVLDSNFKVHGVEGLRVVDASAFPKIPGLFLVVPTMIISEKAAQAIIADARKKDSEKT